MNLKKNIAGILLTSVVCVSAGNLSVTKGTVTVTGEDSSFSVTESATIIEGDNLYIHKGADAALFDKSGKAALMFKEKSECVLLKSDKQTFSVKLTAGEALLKEEGTAKSSIKSGGCTVTPVGTAGAVKVKPDGSPKVGVLEGSMNFTSPDGKSINITGGSFASFNKQNKTFTPVQELPESALESLKEFAGNIPDT
ncbi:MAG: hypothetical protein ACOCSE_04350, partial [Chitinivibrionales bacterium]